MCHPFPSVQTVSYVFHSEAWYCQVSTGLILKWSTWRRRLWGAGCLPCCSCEDLSGPGWPPPLWTSGSEPFYDPWKPQRSSEAVQGGKKNQNKTKTWQCFRSAPVTARRFGIHTGKTWRLLRFRQCWRRAAAGLPPSRLACQNKSHWLHSGTSYWQAVGQTESDIKKKKKG